MDKIGRKTQESLKTFFSVVSHIYAIHGIVSKQAFFLPVFLETCYSWCWSWLCWILFRSFTGFHLQTNTSPGYHLLEANYQKKIKFVIQIIAISLETAFQNGGISFIILNLTFESPISDMANIPMIGFFFCSTGEIILIAFILSISLFQVLVCLFSTAFTQP